MYVHLCNISNNSTVINDKIWLIQLASCPTAAVVDIAGRRILLILSELVMTFALGVMGLYFYMMRTETELFGTLDYRDVTWIPLASLVLFIIGYSLGCGPLSMMMIGELLPNRLKGLTSCIVLMTRWFLAFGVTSIFSTLKDTINDDGTYWLLASICFTGSFYIYFAVPETKGKSLAEIQLYFTGHKQSNIVIAQNQMKNNTMPISPIIEDGDYGKGNVLGSVRGDRFGQGYDNKMDISDEI